MRMKYKKLTFFALITGSCTCLALLASFIADVYWLIELHSHFLPIGSLACFILCIIFAIKKQWGTSAVLFAIFLISGIQVYPYLPKPWLKQPTISSKSIKLLTSNVLSANQSTDKLNQLILKHDPDLVALIEINKRWSQSIQTLKEKYPYQLLHPREDNFGIGVISKIPFESAEVLRLGTLELESIHAELLLDQEPIQILITHPIPPLGKELYQYRNDQFTAMINYMRPFKGHQIITGDLNSSVFSKDYKLIEEILNLNNSRLNAGLVNTWGIASLNLIGIDHCLYSQNLISFNHQSLTSIDSDHMPILCEFALKH